MVRGPGTWSRRSAVSPSVSAPGKAVGMTKVAPQAGKSSLIGARGARTSHRSTYVRLWGCGASDAVLLGKCHLCAE